MKERKTEITVETCEVLVFRRAGGRSHSWCASCDRRVAVISLDDACNAGLSREAVKRQAENGRVHLIETAGGALLICIDSLASRTLRPRSSPVAGERILWLDE